jgi:pimeloyl-ACP methyl ester carboxylesterase
MKVFRFMQQLGLLFLLGTGMIACEKDDADDTMPPSGIEYHQTAKTKFIDAGGIRFAYREFGDTTGIPVLMLSPLAGSMDDWDPAITNGLAQHYKVILFDLPGAGSTNGTSPTSIADMAKASVSFIKALRLQKVNLLGFSMGSFITQQIALTEPGLVNKIILTGTGPKGAVGLSYLPNLLAASANLSPQESFLKFGFTGSAASINAGKLAYERVQIRKVDRDAPVSQESAGAQVQAVLGWAQPAPDALNELKSIVQPVLIAQGKEDVPVPVENAVNMAAYIPNARLVIYPDAAHAALFQYADSFVKEAISFLAEQE